MAKVIGFVSEKGGVGKTTAVYHIGVSLKQDHQASVLLIDTDYQRGGLTCRLIPEMLEDFRVGKVVDTTLYVAYRSLYAESETPQLTVRNTSIGLDLIPASTLQAMKDVNADIQTALTYATAGRLYTPTCFLGAVGMMCREYGGALKYSEQVIYNRLSRTTGIFDSYVTEGDGIRQAAQRSCAVFEIHGPNAYRQSKQFRALTKELKNRMAQSG